MLLLYVSGEGRWCIGVGYQKYGICSSDAPLCPSQATGWMFAVSNNPLILQPAIVKVTCSLHK